MNGRVPIVLLIEHDAIQRGTVAGYLKAAGYCVIPVGRANEALETFATHHVDIALVVADTQTTDLTGPPLLAVLGTIDPLVPVVALSAGVAIDRPTYEYPNVAATLLKPFQAADVLVHVDRVLRSYAGHHAAPRPAPVAAAPPPRARRALAPGAGAGAGFNWPPTEEDLNDIQIVDTTTWQTPPPYQQLSLALSPAPASQPHQLHQSHQLQTLAAPAAASTTELARVEPEAEPDRPVRLVIRGLERRPPLPYPLRLSSRARRSMAVAATAFCGLTLTTLLELRGVPTRDASAGFDPMLETTPTPSLVASHPRVDAMRLIPAERVSSRAVSGIVGRRSATVPDEPAPRVTATSPANAPGLSPIAWSKGGQAARRDVTREITGNAKPTAVASTPPAAIAPRPSPPSDRGVAIGGRASNEVAAMRDGAAAAANAPAAPRLQAPRERGVAISDRASNEVAPTRDGVTTAANVMTPAAAPAAAAIGRPRDDERGIYQVLARYQRAYEQLDVNAARAVWPTLNARALSRAFEGLKAQTLEFSGCRVAMESAEATAICGGSASYVPRVGRQAARTEPREWTFRLRKVDQNWEIAKAEVR